MCRQTRRAARYAGELSMAWGMVSAPLGCGSGKFVAPWARMQWENLSACARACGEAWEAGEVGSSDLQASWAIASCELLTPSWRRVSGD